MTVQGVVAEQHPSSFSSSCLEEVSAQAPIPPPRGVGQLMIESFPFPIPPRAGETGMRLRVGAPLAPVFPDREGHSALDPVGLLGTEREARGQGDECLGPNAGGRLLGREEDSEERDPIRQLLPPPPHAGAFWPMHHQAVLPEGFRCQIERGENDDESPSFFSCSSAAAVPEGAVSDHTATQTHRGKHKQKHADAVAASTEVTSGREDVSRQKRRDAVSIVLLDEEVKEEERRSWGEDLEHQWREEEREIDFAVPSSICRVGFSNRDGTGDGWSDGLSVEVKISCDLVVQTRHSSALRVQTKRWRGDLFEERQSRISPTEIRRGKLSWTEKAASYIVSQSVS